MLVQRQGTHGVLRPLWGDAAHRWWSTYDTRSDTVRTSCKGEGRLYVSTSACTCFNCWRKLAARGCSGLAVLTVDNGQIRISFEEVGVPVAYVPESGHKRQQHHLNGPPKYSTDAVTKRCVTRLLNDGKKDLDELLSEVQQI